MPSKNCFAHRVKIGHGLGSDGHYANLPTKDWRHFDLFDRLTFIILRREGARLILHKRRTPGRKAMALFKPIQQAAAGNADKGRPDGGDQ